MLDLLRFLPCVSLLRFLVVLCLIRLYSLLLFLFLYMVLGKVMLPRFLAPSFYLVLLFVFYFSTFVYLSLESRGSRFGFLCYLCIRHLIYLLRVSLFILRTLPFLLFLNSFVYCFFVVGLFCFFALSWVAQQMFVSFSPSLSPSFGPFFFFSLVDVCQDFFTSSYWRECLCLCLFSFAFFLSLITCWVLVFRQWGERVHRFTIICILTLYAGWVSELFSFYLRVLFHFAVHLKFPVFILCSFLSPLFAFLYLLFLPFILCCCNLVT